MDRDVGWIDDSKKPAKSRRRKRKGNAAQKKENKSEDPGQCSTGQKKENKLKDTRQLIMGQKKEKKAKDPGQCSTGQKKQNKVKDPGQCSTGQKKQNNVKDTGQLITGQKKQKKVKDTGQLITGQKKQNKVEDPGQLITGQKKEKKAKDPGQLITGQKKEKKAKDPGQCSTGQKKEKKAKDPGQCSTGQKKENKKKAGLDRFCPICYQNVPRKDVVKLPGCLHNYCVFCIVRWAEEKDYALCPQCKGRYDSVMTFRNLDGTVHESLQEESICLLRRTHWYLRRSKAAVKGSKVIRCSELPLGLLAEDYEDDEEWDEDYYCTNDIDDTEDFYFSRAAGSARIVLTNRKFGKNGFIRSGRVFAQSTQTAPAPTTKPTDSIKETATVKNPDRKKTNPKGKKALKREQKKREEPNRIC